MAKDSATIGPDWASYHETKVKGDVLAFLTGSGWQVKRQTFYNHCTDGKLRTNRAGVYSRRAVKKYAEACLVHDSAGGMMAGDVAVNLAAQKTRKEIKRIDVATKREEFKFLIERKLYILKSDVAAELAARAVVLDSGLEYMFQTSLAEIIAIVRGDQTRASELLEFLIERKDRQMNEYAAMGEFMVELEIDGDGNGDHATGFDDFGEFERSAIDEDGNGF